MGQRIRVGGMCAAAAAAALVIAAPQASAETWDMTLSGSQQTVGCSYKLSIASAPALASATFYDNNTQIGSGNAGSSILGSGLSVSWTPKTAGTHTLTASVGYLSASIMVNPITVQVGAAAAGSGSSCGGSSLFPSISG
ncbi:hypothetical protein [Nocardia sp.]|uniref:hypothetical protein n=1 Tax=Nocardia sp. TaxID=1821 RepID=UPI00261E68A7|nr:hypothetical protein [Nocardia sp.]